MASGSPDSSPEIVQLVPTGPNGSQLWQPVQGPETADLLSNLGLPLDGHNQLVAEATQVLSRCISPNSTAADKTGWVTGYVQSGNTMSCTTVEFGDIQRDKTWVASATS